jgi:hypothetical protein
MFDDWVWWCAGALAFLALFKLFWDVLHPKKC